tara:strand:- start:226 stop:615 length:390 start_codon:yes stop_codon:yes gene_type:complete
MKIKILILTAILIFNGCRDQSELSMERGEYYYSVDRFEDAVLEYTRVINSYPDDLSSFNSHTIEMIANAHHNLSVIMFKRGYKSEDKVEKKLYLNKAYSNAAKAYDLIPKDTYKKTWDKIQKTISTIDS